MRERADSMKTGMTRGLRYFAMVSVAVVALTAGERGAQASIFSDLAGTAQRAFTGGSGTSNNQTAARPTTSGAQGAQAGGLLGKAQATATQGLTKALVGAATGAVSKGEIRKAAVKVAVAAAGAAVLPIATSKINDALGANVFNGGGTINAGNAKKLLASWGGKLADKAGGFFSSSGSNGDGQSSNDTAALDRTEEDSALWREKSPSDGESVSKELKVAGEDAGSGAAADVAQATDGGCMDRNGCDGESPEDQAVADNGSGSTGGEELAGAAARDAEEGGGTGGGSVAATSGMSGIQDLFKSSNPLAGITGGKGNQCSCVPTWTTGAT